jgi:uncharacterized protein YgiB involved in biofilm formation
MLRGLNSYFAPVERIMMNSSATQLRTHRKRRRTWEFRLLLCSTFSLLAIGGGCFEGQARPIAKSYFFATREACAASGAFRKRDCEAAFANAFVQLREQAPSFSSRIDCQLRFRLCEIRRDDAASERSAQPIYGPVALGVEIADTGAGAVAAAPVFAVETPPGMFPARPVSRAYENHEQNALLAPPTDRFEPFSRLRAPNSNELIEASGFSAFIQEKGGGSQSRETQQDRRARLRNAPLVE